MSKSNHSPSKNSQNSGNKQSSLLEQVDFIGEDEDVDIVATEDSSLFDVTVGQIEDIMVEPEFQELQNTFFSNYNHLFSEDDDNSIECSTAHAEYIEALEKHLESELAKRIDNFCMETFAKELVERRDELDGEVFEVMFTLTDFQAFKEAMLDYQRAMSGEALDVSLDFTVTPLTPRAGGGGSAAAVSASSDMEMASPAASLSCGGGGGAAAAADKKSR